MDFRIKIGYVKAWQYTGQNGDFFKDMFRHTYTQTEGSQDVLMISDMRVEPGCWVVSDEAGLRSIDDGAFNKMYEKAEKLNKA